MTVRSVLMCVLFFCVFLPGGSIAQPGDRYLLMKSRVLDILFPLEVVPKPYGRKMILRFGDDNSQLVVVVYMGPRCEIIRYSLAEADKGELEEKISKMVAENADVQPEVIAAQLKLVVDRSAVECKEVMRSFDKLERIRISPLLADRVAVGGASEFEFWYDTWQESVHYTITGPFNSSRQDRLVEWMLRFRTDLPELLRASREDAK